MKTTTLVLFIASLIMSCSANSDNCINGDLVDAMIKLKSESKKVTRFTYTTSGIHEFGEVTRFPLNRDLDVLRFQFESGTVSSILLGAVFASKSVYLASFSDGAHVNPSIFSTQDIDIKSCEAVFSLSESESVKLSFSDNITINFYNSNDVSGDGFAKYEFDDG